MADLESRSIGKRTIFRICQTVLKHCESEKEEFPRAAEEVKDNTFVDDVMTGDEDLPKAADLALDLKKMMAAGGFPLKKFLSNEPEALAKLEPEDLASHHVVTFSDEEFTTKTLGVKYYPKEDVLMFSFYDKMDDVKVETRRTLLSQLHRIYDPVGLLAPYTVRGKIMLQQAWLIGGEWDAELPTELSDSFIRWKQEIKHLDEVKIPRCYVPREFIEPIFTLHGFGDASELAYNTVVYLCAKDSVPGGSLCTKIGRGRACGMGPLLRNFLTEK